MTKENIKISIDTRTLNKGDYFVPIKGPNFDGNDFVNEALNKGAAGIISEEKLYKLAGKKLKKTHPIVIGVAGSIGKTTFRSFLVQILSAKYKVLDGPRNTKLGLAITIVNEMEDQSIFVAEMGIDRLKEMHSITNFVKPDFSVITKLGEEHIQFLKSFKNIVRENSVAINNSKQKTGYININDKKYYRNCFGKDTQINWFPDKLINSRIIKAIDDKPLPNHDKIYLKGIYQIVSDKFSFTDNDFIKSLGCLYKPKGRLNLLSGINGCTVIDDTYNAVCAQTIIEGLKFAKDISIKQNKKLNLVISNMRETGGSTNKQHKLVAKFLNNFEFNTLTLVGDMVDLYTKYLNKPYIRLENALQIDLKPHKNNLYYIKATRFYKGADLVQKLVRTS